MKVKVMLARFPFGACDHPDTTDWVTETIVKAKRDPRIGEVVSWRVDDTPITMGRNRCLEVARQHDVDIVCMVDSDMKPDAYLSDNPNRLAVDPRAKPFWETSLAFMLDHQGPCAVAAPYCGPPPFENVYIFQWAARQSDNPNVDMRLEQFAREESVRLVGIQEVAALPTGLFMLDMRSLRKLTPPYFYYEWKDGTESEKASTEDVTFTRDLSLAGVPVYCNWDAWAGHWKRKCVGKPALLAVNDVRQKFVDAVKRNQPSNERLVVMRMDVEGLKRRMVTVNGHVDLNPVETTHAS